MPTNEWIIWQRAGGVTGGSFFKRGDIAVRVDLSSKGWDIQIDPWIESEEKIMRALEYGIWKAEKLEMVKIAMREVLTDTQFISVYLVYFAGLGIHGAARYLGVNVSTLFSRQKTGVRKLREVLT